MVHNNFDTDASWSRSSDLRKKTNINDAQLGLEFVNNLRPVTFSWKPNNELPEEFNDYAEENVKDTDLVMHGMIAQDVKAALDKVGIDSDTFGGWSEREDGSQYLSQELFVHPLIKAVQELSTKVEVLEKQLNNKE